MTPAKRQMPIVIGLVLNDRNELLIAKRKNTSDIPEANGKWEFVGGRIEWGESPEAAVVREVKEESGLEVVVEKLLPKVFVNHWSKSNGEELEVFILSYLCKIAGGTLQSEPIDLKIAELRFIDPKDIYNYDTLPRIKEAVELFLL